MSYYIKSIGPKAGVIADVQNNTTLESDMKDLLVKRINNIPDPSPVSSYEAADSVFLEANGHEPSDHTLRLYRFNSAKAPVVAPPPPAENP